jgi:hypothetical protein
MRLLVNISLLALLFGCCFNASAQSPKEPSEVLKQLLLAPAPPPPTPEPEGKTRTDRPQNFFNKENVPPDDAPLQDLRDYWLRWSGQPERPTPSNTVVQRLLDSMIDDFKNLTPFLSFFPPSESFAEKIKQVFDREQSKPEFEPFRSEYKKWLLFNSKYFLGELLAQASKVRDDEKNASIDHDDELVALAKIDWSNAEPLLQTLVNTAKARTSSLALSLLYRHSIDEKDAHAELKFREKLQSIASNRNLPGRARDTAIEALSMSEWSGRDEWYLSLFSDESLIDPDDGHYRFSPLSTLFARDPDKWIPVMAKLVAGQDRIVQQAAASCLVRYVTDHHPRRDAIMPVLRWLTERDWIPISDTDRTLFIQYMDEVEIPESVPALIWIVENEDYNRCWAGRTLAHYKDPRAIPALKKALAEADEDDRSMILEGLIASGGVTETEQVNALEAYAAVVINSGPEAVRPYRQDRLPIPVSVGAYLAELKNPPDTLVRAVLTRAASLRKTNEPLARVLLETAHRWEGRQVDLDLLKRIAANTADAKTIITALERRAKLRESVLSELRSLLAVSGAPQGIGAILLEDNDAAETILSSGDQPAQIALLAAARLTQTPLPIDVVGPLLNSKNSLLAMAAERYLLAEDSKQARTVLWQKHPNEAFITGWRENIPLIAGDNFDRIAKQEEKLRGELRKPGGPVEIFALLNNGEQYGNVLRIYTDNAVYTHYEDASRYRERVVPKGEVSSFKEFISTSGVADLGPQFASCHHNCWVSEFLMLSGDGGRRLFSHGPIGGPTLVLLANLQQLGSDATTHYNFEKEIKGLEVLYSDPNLPVSYVWQHGDQIRIFVERAETDEERANKKADEEEEEDDDNAVAQRRQREVARYYARFSWRSLKGKDATTSVAAPEGYSTLDPTKFPLDGEDATMRRDERQVQAIGANTILIARNFDGLWKQVAGAKAVRISGENGAYVNPVVTPDSKWAVISKSDGSWSEPNYLVRLNLETGREDLVNVEPADELSAIAFLPVHNKILVRRAKDDPQWNSGKRVGPDVPEYYLIDPKTGDAQLVSGEFAPLREEGERFLQPAEETGQYWAAIPDRTKNQTVVVRYNLKDFSFRPVLTVPQISFESMSMWVDEKQGKLYFVYESQLLRLPLKTTP